MSELCGYTTEIMFLFFQTIFHKITTVIAAAAIAIGLISTPEPPKQPVLNNQIPVIVEQQAKGSELQVQKKQSKEIQISDLTNEQKQKLKEIEESWKQQNTEQLPISNKKEENNQALQETINHMNFLVKEMNALNLKMNEYQSGGLTAYQNSDKCPSALELMQNKGISISSKDWDMNYAISKSENEQCNAKKLEGLQAYSSLYQAAKNQYDKLYSEYKQYDLLRLQLLAQ